MLGGAHRMGTGRRVMSGASRAVMEQKSTVFWPLLGSIVLFAALYLAAVGPYWKISPDSVYYVEGAESLAAGNGYHLKLRPPLTSVLLGLPAYLFPGRYLAMNAWITIWALLSAGVGYLFFRSRNGTFRASLLTLLLLGSIPLFDLSTLLLSDVFFLFFSTAALALLGRRSNASASWASAFLAAAAILAACMVRVAGLALVVAVLAHCCASRWRRSGESRIDWRMAVLMMAVLVYVVAWEYRAHGTGYSPVEVATQVRPFAVDSEHISPLDLPARLAGNLPEYRFLGVILSNHGLRDIGVPLIAGRMLAGLTLVLLGLGFVSQLRREVTVAEVYCLVMLLVLGIYNPWIDTRWFLPLTPLLLLYTAQGTVRAARHSPGLAKVVVLLAVLGYSASGAVYMVRNIPEEHTSPFGPFPVKYTHNYDLQRLALELSGRLSDGETYLTMHPDVLSYLVRCDGQCSGHSIPLSSDPEDLFSAMKANRARYLLLDETQSGVREYVFPVLEAYPERLRLVSKQPMASLYVWEDQ